MEICTYIIIGILIAVGSGEKTREQLNILLINRNARRKQ